MAGVVVVTGLAFYFYYQWQEAAKLSRAMMREGLQLREGLVAMAKGPDGIYAAKLTLKVVLGEDC